MEFRRLLSSYTTLHTKMHLIFSAVITLTSVVAGVTVIQRDVGKKKVDLPQIQEMDPIKACELRGSGFIEILSRLRP
jgi:hypothetical protein